jgi:hypothetical protein
MSANNDFYFAQDGSFGSAEELTIFDTTDWTDEDWELIEFSTDMERSDVAQKIWAKYND